MAKISEFGWVGGLVLMCTECPSQFQLAAGDPEAFEKVVQKIVDHKHVIENGASGTINQTATATGPNTSIVQSGRDLHVSNRVTGHTGPLLQAGNIDGGVNIGSSPEPSTDFFWPKGESRVTDHIGDTNPYQPNKPPTHGVEHGYFW